MGMVGVDKIGEIRRAYFEQDRSIKEIVRTLSVSRATVRKVKLIDQPWRIMSIGLRDWAHGF